MTDGNTSDSGSLSKGAESATGGTSKRKKIMFKIAGMFTAIAIGYGIYWTVYARYIEQTNDAYVQGNVVQITPQIAGTVARILVDDTDLDEAGQPLLGLDTADQDVALAQADAQLAQTMREVSSLYAAYRQLAANVTLRESELARTQDDLQRRKALA